MRKLWSRWAAAAVLLALVAYFYRGLIFQGLIVGDYDAFVYFYPLRQYAASVLREGHFPLWNPYLFMGAPFFANVQTAILYPLNALFLLLPTPYAFSASVVFHVLLAAGGMYAFGRRVLEVSWLPALLGAVAFTFSGFISWQVGHINQLSVSAWLPLLLVVFDAALSRRSLGLGIAAGAIGTTQLLAGHTQEWYFSTAALGFLALWRIVAPVGSPARAEESEKLESRRGTVARNPGDLLADPATWTRLRPLAYLALAGLVEAGVAAIQWMPTMELSRESIRGGGMAYGEAISFSLPPSTALYTLLPTYPTQLFSEYVGYVGVIPLVLAVVALVGWGRRPVTLFMVGLSLFGLVMAFGGYNPLAPLLFKWVPGLDLFRVPARWLLIYTFGVAGLAALGAQIVLDIAYGKSLLNGHGLSRISRLWRFAIGAAGVGGCVVLVGILAQVARPGASPRVLAVWGGIAFVALVVSGFGAVRRGAAPVALGVLVLGTAAELWMAGGNAVFQHPIPYEAFKPDRGSTSYLLERLARDGTPERVLSVAPDTYEVKETPDYKKEYAWLDPAALVQFMVDIKLSETLASNIAMEYGIQSADGYDGGVLPLKRYAALKSLVIPDPRASADSQLRINLPAVPEEHFLDLLGVKYALSGKIKDASVENVYYDRGITVALGDGDATTITRMPDMQATAIGVISSTIGARKLGDGTVAGTLVVTDSSGGNHELPLRLGTETAETAKQDATLGPPVHRRPQEVAGWPSEAKETDYYVKIRLPDRLRVKQIAMKGALPPGGVLNVKAITLIDDVAATSSPLVLSDAMDRETFFDMKVYSYNSALPRAFVAYSSMVREDALALGTLSQATTRLDQVAILAPSSTAQSIYRASAPAFLPTDARIRSYQPEEVAIDATAREDGYLVLRDSYYPGWIAEVDGKQQPVERVDYMFRGVFLQKGQHSVVFKYVPTSFYTGAMVSLASIVLLAGAVVAIGLTSRRSHVL